MLKKHTLRRVRHTWPRLLACKEMELVVWQHFQKKSL
jgi:hypothetical protein